MPAELFGSGTVHVSEFADADAFALQHQAQHAEYTRIKNVCLKVEIVQLYLGDWCLRAGRFRPPAADMPSAGTIAIVRAVSHSDRATLCVPVGEVAGARVNGCDLAASELMLFAPGASLHHAVRGRHQDWASLGFPSAEFEALLDQWGQPPLRHGCDRILRLPPGPTGSVLPAAFIAAAALGAAMPAGASAPGCILGMRDALSDLLREIFTALPSLRDRPRRRTRDVLRVVEAADEYLRGHVSRPIYTEELCAALAVCPRTLHNAFNAAYAVSPHSYLKARRLALVRRALVAPGPSRRLVKSIAISHGFWHLGRFARDYFDLFGEMPSQTLECPSAAVSPRVARVVRAVG